MGFSGCCESGQPRLHRGWRRTLPAFGSRLSPLVVDRLFEALVATAHEDGTAVLLVEQQARRALLVADRWYLLRRGVLAATGDTSESDAVWESYVS